MLHEYISLITLLGDLIVNLPFFSKIIVACCIDHALKYIIFNCVRMCVKGCLFHYNKCYTYKGLRKFEGILELLDKLKINLRKIFPVFHLLFIALVRIIAITL